MKSESEIRKEIDNMKRVERSIENKVEKIFESRERNISIMNMNQRIPKINSIALSSRYKLISR
jgi:hypothetical protein